MSHKCTCVIICQCSNDILSPSDSPISGHSMITIVEPTGAGLLGKTRPPNTPILTASTDDYSLFDIKNDYRSYAFTLSPQGVGIMSNKTRDRQYTTLKRCLTEVLSEFKTSYIINFEVYTNNDDALHCHGFIRFKSHNQKEKFKKMLKDKITLCNKKPFPNLIDCEFVNNFESWRDYISKAQDYIISLQYYSLIKIDYSFHQNGDNPIPQTIAIPKKTYKKSLEKPKVIKTIDPHNQILIEQINLNKLEMRIQKQKLKIENLNKILNKNI